MLLMCLILAIGRTHCNFFPIFSDFWTMFADSRYDPDNWEIVFFSINYIALHCNVMSLRSIDSFSTTWHNMAIPIWIGSVTTSVGPDFIIIFIIIPKIVS